MKPFDLKAALRGELVVLRNGETARVGAYCKNEPSHLVLLGWHKGFAIGWNVDGANHRDSQFDIIGMFTRKETRTMWVNVYANGCDYGYQTREQADSRAAESRIACIPVTYEVEL